MNTKGYTSNKSHWLKISDITNDEKVYNEFIKTLIAYCKKEARN